MTQSMQKGSRTQNTVGTKNRAMADIRPIRNEEDYQEALERLEVIFDSDPDTPDGQEAEILCLLIERYEEEHFPIETPDPIEAIKIRMEEMGLKQKDLIGVIGGKSRVSETLNKRKLLTLEMVRNLERFLNIPASILVGEYELNKEHA